MNALNVSQSMHTWLAQIHTHLKFTRRDFSTRNSTKCVLLCLDQSEPRYFLSSILGAKGRRVEIVQEERFSNEGQYEMCIIVPPPIRTKIFSFYAYQEPKLDESDISLQRTEFSCVDLLVWRCSQRNTKIELKLAEKQDIKNQGVVKQLTVLEALNAFPTHNIPAEWISCPLLL